MFYLITTLSDGFRVTLTERYAREHDAHRAAENYIRDYSDPCGLGVTVNNVVICQEAA